MKVLVGETRSKKNVEALQELGWGRMWTVGTPRIYPFEPWGFDNGAFQCFLHNRDFDEKKFLKRLDRALGVPQDPILAVTPDIVAGGKRSLDFSVAWIMRLPCHWFWYLAVQDGMEEADVREAIHLFAGLFLGGSDRFKLTAYRWCKLAHSHRKKFHYGRAGTMRKILHARRIGADSLDSSFPLWSDERMKRFATYCNAEQHQEELPWAR